MIVCCAHPVDEYGADTQALVERTAGARAVCVSPRGETLAEMVDELEAARRAAGSAPWVFFGMSGGSMLGQVYAHLQPEALAGLILASAGPCFRVTVADPACVLCPSFPAWRPTLETNGLIGDDPGAGATVWETVAGVGWVFRRAGGPALLVSPGDPGERMRALMPELLRFDARAWLPAVRVPALVLGGTDDPVAPLAHVRAVHEAIPGSDFLAVAGAAHAPIVERPDEVAAAVRSFLERC